MAGNANSINESTTGICGFTGTAFTSTAATQYAVLVGGSTSSTLSNIGPTSTAGQVLQSAGNAANPAFSTATYPATATGTGTILRANGTNWAATTSTYPDTNAVSTLLYASSANVMAALATANSGVLSTNSSGVPSIDTTNFAVLSTGLQLKGNNTNTAPPAGFLGEQIRSFVTAVSLTSPTPKSVTSILLTAGIWDVSAVLNFSPASGTVTTQASISISATNNTLGSNVGDDIIQYNFSLGANGNMPLTLPSLRITLSSSTTYYLVGQAAFSVSTLTVNGRISATRVG